jgi:pimeloyl-ACP methyl ester carboxylesterase
VRSDDGTAIGLLTAGSGPPLLLVHGGLSGMRRWAPLWAHLVPRFRVTALDRRGRGASGDGPEYAFAREVEDVRAVAERLAGEAGGPVDVFGHSLGGDVVLAAAGAGAPVRRLALYEPPGPVTVDGGWLRKVRGHLAAGRPGPAVVDFLVEVIGLTPQQVAELREQAPDVEDVLGTASRTLVREAEAIAALDLPALAAAVAHPVLLMHGTQSPPWARAVVDELARSLPDAEVVVLSGAGHEGVDTAADVLAAHLVRFFGAP